jgi:hypothetical protein
MAWVFGVWEKHRPAYFFWFFSIHFWVNCGTLDAICPPSATAKDMFLAHHTALWLAGWLDVGVLGGLASAPGPVLVDGLGSEVVVRGVLV